MNDNCVCRTAPGIALVCKKTKIIYIFISGSVSGTLGPWTPSQGGGAPAGGLDRGPVHNRRPAGGMDRAPAHTRAHAGGLNRAPVNTNRPAGGLDPKPQ